MYIIDHDDLFLRRSDASAQVTVCISLFNYQDYVVATLETVRQQGLALMDLIIVDDCSTDESPARVSEWLEVHNERFNRVRLVRHQRNSGGPSAARNTAISLTKTPYIFLLDADNLLFPRCLQRLLAALKDSSAAFAYPILSRFGDKPGLLGRDLWDPVLLSRSNYIDTMSLIRTRVLREVDGFSRMKYYGWEDYELWLKIAEAGHFGLQVPEILAQYRVHAASISSQVRTSEEGLHRLRREITKLHPWVNIRS